MDGMDVDVAPAPSVDPASALSPKPTSLPPVPPVSDVEMADAPSKTFGAIEDGYGMVEEAAQAAEAQAEESKNAAAEGDAVAVVQEPADAAEEAVPTLEGKVESEETTGDSVAVSVTRAVIESVEPPPSTAEPIVDTAPAAEAELEPASAASPAAAAVEVVHTAAVEVVVADPATSDVAVPADLIPTTSFQPLVSMASASPVASSSAAQLPPIPFSPAAAAVSSPTTTAAPASPKAKPKRKRNATAGPSRAARPVHWMGEDNGIIRCICGITEDDGFTIQCEGCNAWEHGQCFGHLDEASAPDNYFCELCDPRPFDAVGARQRQLDAREAQVARIPEEPDRRQRPKAKRPRTDGAAAVEEEEGAAVKPRRRPTAQKPRSKQAAEPVPTPAPELDDDYFLIEPWELEYTAVKDNVVRGWAARHAIRRFYREWIEEEPRRVQHDSGLPSPTDTGVLRLSPDTLLPPPDYSVLAPPVPPVHLASLDPAPTSIQLIDDVSCFLPPMYDADPAAVIYSRPTMYGVFAEDTIAAAAFIGEYRAEVMDAESYRHDPINQYAHLGLPKPHVRALGPPVNLVLDARGYGSEMRFVRSACHPNAVLRPILVEARLKFGLFAARDISKGEEIVLAWEWDDQHIVHALRAIEDPSVLASKYDVVLTHLLGTFSSCACTSAQTCALAQMARLVEGKNATRRRGLGDLVGAVRGWRRDEVEADRMKKLDRSLAHGLFAPSPANSSPSPAVKEVVGVPTPPSPSAMPSPRSVRLASSSELSAAPDREEEGEDELDEGDLSDATTATVVRDYTDNEDEMDVDETEVEAEPDIAATAFEAADSDDDVVRRPVGRRRRVSSPPAKPTPRKPSPPRKPVSKPRSDNRRDKSRRARKVIASSDDEADESRSTSQHSPVARAVEPRATVPEQVIAPMAEPMDEDVAAAADVPVVPLQPERESTPVREPTPRETTPVREPTPKEPTPPPEPPKKVAFSEYLKNHKIRKVSQPVPDGAADVTAEPDAPSSAPAPAPAALTALGLSTSGLTTAAFMPAPATPAAAVVLTPAKEESRLNLFEHLPTRTPSLTPAVSPYTPSTSAYMPRSDYFPPQTGSAYVPRAREDSIVSTPGVASAYVPREATTPAADAHVSAYMPREPSTPAAEHAYAARELGPTPTHLNSLSLTSMGSLGSHSSHSDHSPPSALPPPATRDLPPHAYGPGSAGGAFGSAGSGQAGTVRPPPTGPRNPPTGPRGSWNGPVSPVAPTRPLGFGRGGGMGGGFRGGPDRGFFRGGRGAFRGRGR
ncbi:SET domain-containing protein 3 [Cryptotrichosporon argae]